MFKRFLAVAVVALFAITVTAPSAHAQQSAGAQSGFTFGGTGIDNSHVITNDNSGMVGFTLGLTISTRCAGSPQVCGAPVTNDGSDLFSTAAGSPFGNALAGWNFDFGVLGNTSNDNFELLYGMNGGPMGTWLLGTDLNDSENFGFGFLTTGIPGAVTPPPGFSFSNTGNSQIELELVALNKVSSNVDAFVNECVNIGTNTAGCTSPSTSVPEPGTMGMLATGLVGMAGISRRRRYLRKQ